MRFVRDFFEFLRFFLRFGDARGGCARDHYLYTHCRLGRYPAGRDRWGGKRAAGGMSEDNDRCFSMLVLGAFSIGVFQHHCMTPH